MPVRGLRWVQGAGNCGKRRLARLWATWFNTARLLEDAALLPSLPCRRSRTRELGEKSHGVISNSPPSWRLPSEPEMPRLPKNVREVCAGMEMDKTRARPKRADASRQKGRMGEIFWLSM